MKTKTAFTVFRSSSPLVWGALEAESRKGGRLGNDFLDALETISSISIQTVLVKEISTFLQYII